MKNRDTLHRFLFEQLSIRGEIIHLDSVWQVVLHRHDYPPAIRRLLGEAMAAAVLLSATIKFDGLLSLQLQGEGPVRLLLVQCTSEGTLRGLARWEGEVTEASFRELCGGGILAITIDPGEGRERYQGIVDLVGDSLSAALEHYFNHSEQLDTHLQLVTREKAVAGLLLQRLPGEVADPEAWCRVQQLGSTLTESELLDLDARTIILRLFHEEEVRLFDSLPISFRCTCSRERTARMLRSLGYKEIQDMRDKQHHIEVACEFCGTRYVFDPVDLDALFTLMIQPNIPTTRH